MHWLALQHAHPQTPLLDVVGMLAGILWSLTYVGIIRSGRKDRFCGMPLAALIANVTWEFIFTFILHPKPSCPGPSCFQDWFSYFMAMSWFVLDVGIVILWLKYWQASWPPSVRGVYRYPLFVFSAAVAAGVIIGVYLIIREYSKATLETAYSDAGVYTAFAMNLMMSILFMTRLARLNTTRGQSMFIALTKMFGTAAASIYWFWMGRTELLWVTVYVAMYVFDIVYTAMLNRRLHAVPMPAPA